MDGVSRRRFVGSVHEPRQVVDSSEICRTSTTQDWRRRPQISCFPDIEKHQHARRDIIDLVSFSCIDLEYQHASLTTSQSLKRPPP